MADKAKTRTKSRRRPWTRERHESFVAAGGLALAVILLLLVGLTAWWNVTSIQESERTDRLCDLEELGESLQTWSRVLLMGDDLETMQKLVVSAGRTHQLESCSLTMLDGTVLAHSDATRITGNDMPAVLPQAPVDVGATPVGENLVSYDYLVPIPERGTMRLTVTGALGQDTRQAWQKQSGIAMFGALALLAILLVYRRIRTGMRPLALIGDALLASTEEGVASEALLISGDLGPEAVAWNAMVEDRQRLRDQALRRQAGEMLSDRRSGHADLFSAFNLMRQGMIIVDRDLNVTFANGAAGIYLDFDADEVVGTSVTPRVDEKVLALLREVVGGTIRSWVSAEVEREGAGEARDVLRISARPLRRDDVGAAVILVEDVTQQRIADQSRNQFVAQVTHELRAPLTNIRLYAEMAMEDGVKDNDTLQKSLNVINQESQRLDRVVDDMLSIAEIEAGQYELNVDDLRLGEMFKTLQRDYEAAARSKDIELDIVLPPKLPSLRGDREKVSLALHNLVGNAIKYTPRGGRIAVQVEADDRQLHVSVVDSGIGIAPEELERVFERFYRADDKRVAEITGSGLGLALARDVARMHGGDITVESQVEQGTTFSMVIPTIRKAA